MARRTRSINSSFSRAVQPRPCIDCGKLTTGIDSTLLCRPCYDICGLENAHSDGHHADAAYPGCPNCEYEAERARLAPLRAELEAARAENAKLKLAAELEAARRENAKLARRAARHEKALLKDIVLAARGIHPATC